MYPQFHALILFSLNLFLFLKHYLRALNYLLMLSPEHYINLYEYVITRASNETLSEIII